MSSAKRTPRYVDALRPFDVSAGSAHSDVIRLRPEPPAPTLPRITEAWPRVKAVPLAHRPWQLLLVPPTPGAPTRAFHVRRWQARLVLGVAITGLVLLSATAVAVVLAFRSPDLFATSAEAALLRDRLTLVEDSLATVRAELDAMDTLVVGALPGGGELVAAGAAPGRTAARTSGGTLRPAARRSRASSRTTGADEPLTLGRGAPDGLPVMGSIASRFSRARRHPLLRVVRPHLGVDVAARRGTRISAPSAGRVSFVGRKFGYGLVIEVDHGSGVVTRYAHCGSALVSKGDRVRQGSALATVGTSGLATGPHLHYEVLVNGRQVDPLRYRLPRSVDSVAAPAPETVPATLSTPVGTAPVGEAPASPSSPLAQPGRGAAVDAAAPR